MTLTFLRLGNEGTFNPWMTRIDFLFFTSLWRHIGLTRSVWAPTEWTEWWNKHISGMWWKHIIFTALKPNSLVTLDAQTEPYIPSDLTDTAYMAHVLRIERSYITVDAALSQCCWCMASGVYTALKPNSSVTLDAQTEHYVHSDLTDIAYIRYILRIEHVHT